MSELEEKAAEYARRLRTRAAQEAETERTAAQEEARKRDQAKEFFAFARRHGAPALPRYYVREEAHEGRPERYERIDELCVVARAWNDAVKKFDGRTWAVSADGAVHREVSVSAWPGHTPRELGIVDRWFFITRYSDSGPNYINTDSFYDEALPAAAAALLEPAPLAQGMSTGLQDNGWIGYRPL
ncbi:hypothetical protein [Nocardiopsis halophila]|uniref:hypothetical protein n=1 Tax=Nocardiopsis halophila TaxID=141692 RepID=UPI00034C4509|nr:hypothetical protein [Nocardiopsis halophila]